MTFTPLFPFPKEAFKPGEPNVEVRAFSPNRRYSDALGNVRSRRGFSPFVFGNDRDDPLRRYDMLAVVGSARPSIANEPT